jgi:hypothetical protein
LRARLAKLEAARPSPVRRFIVVAGEPDQIGPALVAALEARGELTILSTGVPSAEPQPPVVYEQVGAAWVLADPQALAA